MERNLSRRVSNNSDRDFVFQQTGTRVDSLIRDEQRGRKGASATSSRPKELKWKITKPCTAVIQIMSSPSNNGGTLHSLAALEFHAQLGCFLFFAPRLETFEGLARAHLPRVPVYFTASAWRRWAAAEGSLWISFVSVAQLLPSPPPWKGGGCSLKNERGPLVCPCFIFISFLSPRFLAPLENNMPPFTDNIMSGYADTWEEGEMLGEGKEVNNVTDVQDFTVKFFLSFSVCRRNKTVAGVEEAEGYRVLLSPVPPAFPLCEFSLPKRPSIEWSLVDSRDYFARERGFRISNNVTFRDGGVLKYLCLDD